MILFSVGQTSIVMPHLTFVGLLADFEWAGLECCRRFLQHGYLFSPHALICTVVSLSILSHTSGRTEQTCEVQPGAGDMLTTCNLQCHLNHTALLGQAGQHFAGIATQHLLQPCTTAIVVAHGLCFFPSHLYLLSVTLEYQCLLCQRLWPL